MEPILNTYVGFYYCGSPNVLSGYKLQEKRHPISVVVPSQAFAFRFQDRFEAIGDNNGKPIPFYSGWINNSPIYFVDAVITTIRETNQEFIHDDMFRAVLRELIEMAGEETKIIRARGNIFSSFIEGVTILL